jgi:hypothetical protein
VVVVLMLLVVVVVVQVHRVQVEEVEEPFQV